LYADTEYTKFENPMIKGADAIGQAGGNPARDYVVHLAGHKCEGSGIRFTITHTALHINAHIYILHVHPHVSRPTESVSRPLLRRGYPSSSFSNPIDRTFGQEPLWTVPHESRYNRPANAFRV